MSADTIPSEVVRTLTHETVCGYKVAAYRETHPEHGAAYGHTYSEHWSTPNSRHPSVTVERLFTEAQLRDALTDRSTRPAEPAAPVAEAGDGDAIRRWMGQRRGETAKVTRIERVAEIWRDQGLEVTEWVLHSALEAERAKADELRRLLTASGRCVDDLTARLDTAEQRAADALARAEKAEGALETAREDTARLDYLDRCNQALNAHYGTTYRWELVQSHNVNRLMLGHMVVDLNDSAAKGLPSCRDAIDRARRESQPATDGGDNG